MNEEKSFASSHYKSHFVLNTLGNLRYLIKSKPEEAEQMMDVFINYTKDTLRFENLDEWNTFSKELRHLKDYESLMVMRFGNHFNVSYELAETDLELPAFTLQGLVENAFYHGVRDLGDQGCITVRSYKEQDQVIVEVRDNGNGIADTAAVLEEADAKHTFLGNLNAAISTRETAALLIQSVPGEGTCFQIIMTI